MKKQISGIGILTLIVLVAIGIYYVLVATGAIFFFGDNPPEPEITYGEFPFRLEYEIYGKNVVVEDTLICKFDGFGANEGLGKYRKWTGSIATNGNDVIVLLEIDKNTKIIYPPGNPQFYMDDLKEYITYNPIFPDAVIERKNSSPGQFDSSSLITADRLLEEYNIKLISWEIAPPIENTFK